MSASTVSKTESRGRHVGLDWSAVEALDDPTLEARLYGRAQRTVATERVRPDPVWMHAELRKAGVTLELLHLEYLREHPNGYQYPTFAETYRGWLKTKGLVMRQLHKAGDKAFVDYSGKKPHIVDASTGEVRDVELFVFVLGASNFTYAEATLTQTVGDFVASHVRALEYIGGVPRVIVPDQLRSAISVPCRFEPTVHRTYAEFGRHYGTAIVPARPRKPRDKAKVEVAVQVAQRWILASLRNEMFFSLPELNTRIRELLEALNRRPMKKFGGVSRRELFEQTDQSALSPLAETRFAVSEWKRAKVNLDYHVAVDHHFYSVPFTLVHEELEVRLTESSFEAYFQGKRVASHPRSREKYRFTTVAGHMPEAHRAHFFGADMLLAWAKSVGPWTEAMVTRLFDVHLIREQGWRSAKGLERLEKPYGPARLERACRHGLYLGAKSYKPIERILKLGRDAAPFADEPTHVSLPITHDNVRGPHYFR